MKKKNLTIGFIGQGFVGKSYADDFEERGFDVVRYSLEPEYTGNKTKINKCDIVFIAVPTPSTTDGFDSSIVENSLSLVGRGKIAVIKSTVLPGTTDKFQKQFSDKLIFVSPEFLNTSTAKKDAKNPILNIVGFSEEYPECKKEVQKVMSIMPKSKNEFILTAKEAELFKYTHNIHGFFRVIFANLIYDLSQNVGVDYDKVKQIMDVDPYMTNLASYYNNPLHKTGRGAGGACFIKDFAAFVEIYKRTVGDKHGVKLLEQLEKKNLDLLLSTNKDLDIVHGVYGKNVRKKIA